MVGHDQAPDPPQATNVDLPMAPKQGVIVSTKTSFGENKIGSTCRPRCYRNRYESVKGDAIVFHSGDYFI